MQQGWRILIVDGSKYFDQVIWRRAAAASNLEVVGLARSSAEALAAIQAFTPDLVLIDLSAGQINGLQIIKAVHQAHPQLPVFALSPTVSQEAIVSQVYSQAARAAGALATLPKAEAVALLLPTISATLAARSLFSRQMQALMMAGLANMRLLAAALSHWPRGLIGAELGLVGGAAGVVLTITLVILIQLLLPPSVVFLPGVVPLTLVAILTGLGASWLFSRGVYRFSPHWFHDRRNRFWQITPICTICTCLLQVFLFTRGW